ncbi:MAG: 3-dehydroquinate synthase [Candidatus Omnitrophica bacterium]|nr:3-dehydroquinate synthase [Candidatus Omnitrophota bacterium]
MEKIRVNLGDENSHNIYIGYPLEKIAENLKFEIFGNKIIILSDKNVFSLYGENLKKNLKNTGKKIKEIVIQPGEKQKNLKTVLNIIEKLLEFQVNRDDLILNLGGGVISDIGGFVASIYMRGIKYGNIPTTLLSQVDASIGGKTGINMEKGKNLIGSFYQPVFIYIDLKTLSTLPYREIKQGLSEIVKYGVIKNKDIFEKLEKIQIEELEENFEYLVKESIKIKVNIVEKDEKEKKGLREILNFGHTLGHGIEISNLKRFSHGEAVYLGMLGESFISYKKGICDIDIYKRIKELGEKFNFLTTYEKINIEILVNFLKYDKKIKKEKLRFVLPEKIGKCKIGVEIEEQEIIRILKELKNAEKN